MIQSDISNLCQKNKNRNYIIENNIYIIKFLLVQKMEKKKKTLYVILKKKKKRILPHVYKNEGIY